MLKMLPEDTVQTVDNESGRRPGRLLSAALLCLIACLCCAGVGQVAARGGGSQSVPLPTEEETHEGHVKASKALANSWRKAPHRHLLTLARTGLRVIFRPTRELCSDLAERWDAHSDRRRGPPSSLLPS